MAARAKRSPHARKRPSLRGFARLRKRIATGKLTRRQQAKLLGAGFGPDEQALLVAASKDPGLKNRDLVRSPSKNLAVMARSTAWRDTGHFFRLWTVHPQVVDAAKLGA